MQVGISEVQEALRCRRRWNFASSNRLNLERRLPNSPALPLGTVVHASLSAWMEQEHGADKGKHSLPAIYNAAATVEFEKILESYKAGTGTVPTPLELDPLTKALLMGESMMKNYEDYWGQPLPPGFELVSPEQEVRVPIPNTEHFDEWIVIPNDEVAKYPAKLKGFREIGINADDPKLWHVEYDHPHVHYFRGRLDGIAADKKGRLFVVEHKTYNNRPREAVLRMNVQFIAYHWALIQLNIGPVGGVAYDGIWKRAAPPRGSTLEDLFFRTPIQHAPAEISEFEAMLANYVLELASNPTLIYNRTWDGSCDWGCGVKELCLAMSRGEDVDYVRRTLYQPKPAFEAKSYDLE